MQNIPSQTDLPLGGRITHFYDNWEKITQDTWVLDAVTGHKLEFTETPHQAYVPKMHVTLEEAALIDLEVQALHQNNAISRVSNQNSCRTNQFVSPLFTVPKKGGGHRPVINLKMLNQFIEYQHFKMEGIPMLKDLLKPGDFLTKIDLKDAYLTVPIWRPHQRFLRFVWKNEMWEFLCLPFGLASAPRTFTKLSKPVVGHLRKMGIRLIIYLDDILIMSESKELAQKHTNMVVSLLSSLGFVVNKEKSVFEPTQVLEFLGFQVSSVEMSLSLPGEKIRSIKKECQHLLNNPTVEVRVLSRLLGKLSASIQAVFPAPLHYQSLLKAKNLALKQNQSYETLLSLDQVAIQELIWWRDHLSAWNGKSLLKKPDSLIIETDASNLGWGATCNGIRTGGLWSHQERLHHINCLELMAGGFSIKSFCKNKASIQVKLLMDNTTAIAYVNKMGGPSPVLASLVFEIWQWCLQRQIHLSAQHIPGVHNVAADEESRVDRDMSDWKLSPAVFSQLNNTWGPFEVDLFATLLTNQLPRFVSWRPDPEAEATDAFTQNWSLIKGYAFPPFNLVGRCLAQMRDQKVEWLCIVTPIWETQSWYPLLLEMSGDYPQLLPAHPGLLTKGEEQHPLSHLQLAGWLVSANPIRQWEFQSKLKPYYCRLGENKHQVPMTLPGGNGVAGVINNKLIHFMPLSNM